MEIPQEHKLVVAQLTVKMAELGLEVKPVPDITSGPVITAYRFLPQGRTRVTHIEALAKDFATILGVEDVQVIRMPGESAVSVFVPNKERKLLQWKDVVPAAQTSEARIPLTLGVDWIGKIFIEDLAKLPHLLIAGTTGSGKSTLLKELITTIVYSRNTNAVRFVMSDPKMVELTIFKEIPHLLAPIATTMYETWQIFDDTTAEIDDRLKRMSQIGVTNIEEYNAATPSQPMFRIVVVLDELAELLGGSKRGEAKMGETKLSRIVAKARAAGVHVIAATQRPSVDVVGGVVKANFPARTTFKLPDRASSMTILDQAGAEHLLSQGDMLYRGEKLRRLHVPYASAADIKAVIEAAKYAHAMPPTATRRLQ